MGLRKDFKIRTIAALKLILKQGLAEDKAALAKKLEISGAFYHMLIDENSKKHASLELIERLLDKFPVNPEWILLGRKPIIGKPATKPNEMADKLIELEKRVQNLEDLVISNY